MRIKSYYFKKKRQDYLVRSFVVLLMFVFATTSTLTVLQRGTHATPLANWSAGRIIDDGIMTNSISMTPTQVQDFLNSKVPTCDTNGQQISEYGGPDLNGDGKVQRWEWGKANYNQTTFICLKDYSENGLSAPQIIYNAAQKYSINPQVLIVLLQKEQGLVTDTWPLNIQYRTATGYGCPDTAPCDSQYYGLTNQLNWSATMFRAIQDNSPTWYTPYILGNNYIQWNPNSACGGSTVNIQNRSTQALYNYTPYQPNQAALNAMYGSGDSCSSYGNRNFYLYFNDWFSSTLAPLYAWKQVDKSTFTDSSMTTRLDPSNIKRGESFYVEIKALNTGNATWRKGILNQQVNVGTSNLMDRRSVFCDVDWLSPNGCNRTVTTVENEVLSGSIGTFRFWMTAPTISGVYNEYFNLVMDGTSWLNDIGFYWRFTVGSDFSSGDAEPSDSLGANTAKMKLRRNERLVSTDGNSVLIFKPEGYLEIYKNFRSIWKSTASNGASLVLENDGNLILYSTNGQSIWSSNTQNGSNLVLQNDGNLVLYSNTNQVVWSTNSSNTENSQSFLGINEIMYRGQILRSSDKKYLLALQKDGNLVLYSPSRPLWSTRTDSGFLLAQQSDGNLVLYNQYGLPVWANGSNQRNSASYLQTDANFVTYNQNGLPLWATNTVGTP